MTTANTNDQPLSLEPLIAEWLTNQPPENRFTMIDAFTGIFGIKARALMHRSMQTRMGIALKKLGCQRVRDRSEGVAFKWYPPATLINTRFATKVNDQPSACFASVPATTLPGGLHVPAFRVAKYLTSKGDDGRAMISATREPWVNIDYRDANAAAKAAGMALITESQNLALAYQIALQPNNWTSCIVGEGKLLQGLRNGSVGSAQAGNQLPPTADECRSFALPGGQSILDAAGNAFTWVFDDIQGNEQGIVSKPFADDSPSLVIPYPSEDKGQGWTPPRGRDWSGDALIRGGFWFSESDAGVFNLNYGWRGYRLGDVGFRCTLPGL